MSAEMHPALRLFVGFSLVMLLGALVLGLLAALAFLLPALELPFVQLRPMHVSAALFWIITAATAGIIHYKEAVFGRRPVAAGLLVFMILWMVTVAAVFLAYGMRRFGGREYWEFPPWLCLPILVAWVLWIAVYLRSWRARPRPAPMYVWMWTTGIMFFLVTFLEQNLYWIPWFRDTFLREISVQWKSNGAMVGAWNQMIYGTALFLMVRISGDERLAHGRKVFFFWFLGLSNLMFNWGHHIYNVPTASWIRHVAYAISMTEWIFFVSIIRGFKARLAEHRRLEHLLTYRFLTASELWVFLNLLLALLMSIPAINRYTHGTHITVAHAMGATIGINTMILLAVLGHMLRIDERPPTSRRWIMIGLNIALISLLVFWLALIAAGALKGYRSIALDIADHQRMMGPVNRALYAFTIAGLGVVAGLGTIALIYLRALWGSTDLEVAALAEEQLPSNDP